MKARKKTALLWPCIILLAGYLAAPEAAFASGGGGDKWGILLPVGRIFNLGLVIFVLVWIGRRPLAQFFVSRTQSIHERLAEAQKAREDAEARLADIESRMSRLGEELEQIKAAAEREAGEEHRRLIAEAERDAEKIVDRARQEIDGMMRAAHIELKAYVAGLSLRLAEDRIRAEITDQDRGRLFDRFVTQLGGEG